MFSYRQRSARVARHFAVLLFGLAWIAPSHALPALDFTDGLNLVFGVDRTAGWSFSVSSSVTVDALGFFDDDADGLASNHDVGLWTSAGTLLAQATVTNAGTRVASTSGSGQWLFQGIAPLLLSPGDYVIGATFTAFGDALFADADATTLGQITFGESRFSEVGTGLRFPSSTAGEDDGYFGPNFSILQAVPMPEPGALALVALVLCALALGRARARYVVKRTLFFTSGIVLLGIAGIVPLPAVAQTTANGPYYAWPAWDQQLQCDTQSTCPRFIVLANWRDANFPAGGAAVLDRETGLVWERSPRSTPQIWQTAQFSCNRNALGGRQGWRLPTIQEMASLVEVGQSNPALPDGHPFANVQPAGVYWSGTTFAPDPGTAWDMNMSGGFVDRQLKSVSQFVWCVRGAQGVDPQ